MTPGVEVNVCMPVVSVELTSQIVVSLQQQQLLYRTVLGCTTRGLSTGTCYYAQDCKSSKNMYTSVHADSSRVLLYALYFKGGQGNFLAAQTGVLW